MICGLGVPQACFSTLAPSCLPGTQGRTGQRCLREPGCAYGEEHGAEEWKAAWKRGVDEALFIPLGTRSSTIRLAAIHWVVVVSGRRPCRASLLHQIDTSIAAQQPPTPALRVSAARHSLPPLTGCFGSMVFHFTGTLSRNACDLPGSLCACLLACLLAKISTHRPARILCARVLHCRH